MPFALVSNGDLINRFVRRRHPGYRVHASGALPARALKESLQSERAHLVALGLGIAPICYALLIGWNGWALWLGAANIACNLYPALLQRHTRGRLARLGRRRPLY